MPERHDCAAKGHVMVEDDPSWECLVCEHILEVGDVIGVRVSSHRRHLGEMVNPEDTASIDAWGTGGTIG